MTDFADTQDIIQRRVERAASARSSLHAWADGLYRVSMDSQGREFTAELFAKRAGRAAFAKGRGR